MADGHDIVSFDSITFTQTTAIANGNIATQNQPIDLKGATVLRFTVYDPIGSITIKYKTLNCLFNLFITSTSCKWS